MPSLAVMATRPGREAALREALLSLRPQVDQLRVIFHDREEPPHWSASLVDESRCEPDRRGSAAKLEWSLTWRGLYLGCDDDFAYPPDYVHTMLRWVQRWKGRAIVTCHGRRLYRKATQYLDADFTASPRSRTTGGWLNWPGACSIAWDTRLQVPDRVPGKNLEEAHLATWAQQHGVPIWLVPKEADWLRYLLPDDPGPTIWAEEKATGFASRNRVIAAHTKAARRWRVFRAR